MKLYNRFMMINVRTIVHNIIVASIREKCGVQNGEMRSPTFGIGLLGLLTFFTIALPLPIGDFRPQTPLLWSAKILMPLYVIFV